MVLACLASIAILAGGIAAVYGSDWYKRRKQNRKLKEEDDQYIAKEPIAEQVT
ncbi:MAG TPA: hypothetical protein VE619_11715 [Nitrososphaeraceae archaeon]|nr:hypothetical protein [Nitrososphaeraceae archaeon]